MSIGEIKSVLKSSKDFKGNGLLKKDRSSQEREEHKLKLRRTQSVAKAEEITGDERKVRRSQVDKPCHEARDSLFSWSSGFDKYEGFINWGALILVLGGTRLFLENALKYGFRMNPMNLATWLYKENESDFYYHTPLLLLVSHLHYLLTIFLEVLMSKNLLSGTVGVTMQVINIITIVVIPILINQFWAKSFSLLGRIVMVVIASISCMKLWSYVQVNYWCRVHREHEKKFSRPRSHSFRNISGEESEDDKKVSPGNRNFSYCPVEYPDNLTIKDFYYFLAAPTLCYELNFPRSTRIRKRFLLRRLLEVFVLSNILLGTFQQWIIPSVRNSFKPFSEMDYVRCIERVLKLAIPNHLMWLIWFYLLFHSTLNTIGELLKFSDRNFYQDWWNSKDVGTFWRLWNMPVHKWCVRHLFVPLIRMKYSRVIASLAVFSLSAFFHEYVVSIPLGMYKSSVFLSMLVQVPLVSVSSFMSHHLGYRAGNVMVWANLILGQPVGIMVYYHDYIVQNFDIKNLEF